MSNIANVFYTNIGGGQSILKSFDTEISIWKHKEDVYHSYHESPFSITIVLNYPSLDNGKPAQRINAKYFSFYHT